ncbi:MAG: class II aldolase/adducin family protein [Nitrososphaerota archaeon]|nr:class II aldolase/adducin family protein [Nitrososphaerota archaeon]MDG6923751.1 class II aldolase/adducin family protein [Nitrososphaerota archaeon]
MSENKPFKVPYELREKLATANRILYFEQTTSLARGHQAVLIDDNKLMLPGHLHPFGLSIADCKPDDLVVIDFEGNVLEGKHKEAMGEFYIYTSIFRNRKDVKSCIHIHPPYLGALVVAGKTILPVTRDSLQFIDQVALFEKFPLYIGTKEHGEAAAKALGNKKVLAHRGHGAVVVGGSIEEALYTALAMERAARTQWMASVVGEPQLLPKDEVEKYLRSLASRGPNEETLRENFLYNSKKLEKIEKIGGMFYPY